MSEKVIGTDAIPAIAVTGEVSAKPEAAFPRSSRLLTAADFKSVFTKPRRSRDELFTVLAAGQQKPEGARLGLAISKKELKRAVDRNRIKRLVRESFRQNSKLGNRDYVVMCRKRVMQLSNEELRQRLDEHWLRLSKPAGRSKNNQGKKSANGQKNRSAHTQRSQTKN